MEDSQCSVIVNYLPLDVDDEQLRKMFADYGEIVKAYVAKNKSSGASLSYAFVTFARKEEAVAAIAALNGMQVGSKHIKVSFAKLKQGDIHNRKLFVRCLPLTYTEEQIRDLFAEYGDIIECRLLLESDKVTSRGCAFVEFKSAAECENAINSLNNSVPPGATASICVYYARPPPGTENTVDTPRVPHLSCTPPTNWVTAPPTMGPLPSSHYPSSPCRAYSPSAGVHMAHFPPSPGRNVSPYPHSPVRIEQSGVFSFPSSVQELNVRVSGLPPYVNLKQFLDLFEPYGHIVSAGLDHSLNSAGIMSFGTGRLRIVTTQEQLQLMIRSIHNYVVFDGYPPLQLTIQHSA